MTVALLTQAVYPWRNLMRVTLEPLTSEWYATLWGWLHERPSAHFDDTAPKDFSSFKDDIGARRHRGESLWLVRVDDAPAGAMGYAPITHRTGMLHGVCISRAFSGRGVADAAITLVLEELSSRGVEKVSASYFADNTKIRQCLARAGFLDEGYLMAQTTKQGRTIDMRLVAKLL